jgi:hypothetical protein
MQKVTIKLANVTIHQHGPLWEQAEWINGKLISPEVSDTIAIPPGEPYECTIDEAVKLLRKKQGEVVSEPAPQACLDAIAAYDAEQAARFPPYVPRPEDRGVGSLASFSGSRDGGERW